MAKLVDAPDLGSGGKLWGFKSLYPHQIAQYQSIFIFTQAILSNTLFNALIKKFLLFFHLNNVSFGLSI